MKTLVIDLKIGDSFFLYGVECTILEITVEDTEILFKTNNGFRRFKKTLRTRAIIR